MLEKVAADEDDDCSSYGTEDSGEGDMETRKLEIEEGGGEAMQSLKASLASICAVQATVIEKLASLESMVLTVQFDMTRVRDGMKVVNNVMDNISEHVCGLGDAIAEEGLRPKFATDVGACATWKGKGNVEVFAKSPAIHNLSNKEGSLPDRGTSHDPTCYEPGSYIEDTQRFDMNGELNTNIMSSPEDDRGHTGGNGRPTLHALCSAPCTQTMGTMDVDELPEESQSVEMSCPSTQLPTSGPVRTMWKDFTNVVREWPAPTAVGFAGGEGWVSAKRGRGTSPEYGQDSSNRGKESGMQSHASLNLNISPDRHVVEVTMAGKGDDGGNKGIDTTSRYGTKGRGRGTARARRPAAVQPRYHSSVRAYLNP